MGENQGRFVPGLDDVGHGEGFSGAGDAQKGLVFVALLEALDEAGDGIGLIASGL